MRQKLAIITQSWHLPAICILCNQFHKNKLAVCHACMDYLNPLGITCQNCAYPLPDDKHPLCGRCIKHPPHFDRTLCAYGFDEPLRTLLHRFKYHNELYLRSFISHLMMHALQSDYQPQCLIPVPMHPEKIKLRGFNQAAVLTKILAKKLEVPYDLRSCEKVINTAPQANLDGEQRKKNLRHAFVCDPLPYKHITLVDDLITTGATANELALVLKKAGVQRVDLWCCARTLHAGD